MASDIGWRADGMARARAAGGIELETYRRPGFISTMAVRRCDAGPDAEGFVIDADPEPPYDEED